MILRQGIIIGFCGKGVFYREGNCFSDFPVAIGEDLDAAIKETAKYLTAHQGVICATPDQYPLEQYSLFVFADMPARDNPALMAAKRNKIPCLLVIEENPLIDRRNAEYDRYKEFARVFTYEDETIKRYGCTRLDYAVRFPDDYPEGISFNERKFACMISSLVKKLRPGLTSYHRLWTIDYYERNHPREFDLYGIGWDQGRMICPKNEFFCRLIATSRASRFLPSQRKVASWKGRIAKKIPIISRYKFSYCYENTTSIAGYITEKLFDVLRSGAVPVYLGSPETRKIFPKNLYVDRADFENDEDCYRFLSSMSETEWMSYYNCGREYVLDKQQHWRFSVEYRAKILSQAILEEVHHG